MPAVTKEHAEYLTGEKAKQDGKVKPGEKYYDSGKGRETRKGPDGFSTEKEKSK